ncbi:MAG: SMC family ATPase [Leptolyngbya sp. SIO1D8]|nr:SMC family ATPase [Leptolyngbya sp. SIO1D8]
MIPKQLTLRNFLSYREAILDFQGLQVACISGPNGAGKSSLLEAIAWAIWGQSRAATEDDVIHLGAMEAQVDFTFEHQQQVYRVMRSRRRHQGGTLEFQVKTEQGFRPLTQRGMRATQQLITTALRLDYETFVNSAYLRQGRADEFMLKRPSERKQILADLLKLEQYDQLSEQAKERAREAKAQVTPLENTLASMGAQIEQRSAIAQEATALENRLATLQTQQDEDVQQLQRYQQQQQQRQQLLQTQALQQQQVTHLVENERRLQQEQAELCKHLKVLEGTLAESAKIETGLQMLKTLEAEEAELSLKFGQQQALQVERDRFSQAYQTQTQALQTQRQQQQLNLTTLEQQIAELRPILEKREQVAEGLAELTQARNQLQKLEQLQLRANPLRQREQILQQQLGQTQAELKAQLTALSNSETQLQQQQAQYPRLQQAVLEVGCTLEELKTKRAYQEKVREKGIERRHFMERLQAEQRSYELQLGQIEQKLQLLKQPDAPCPVCDRPLQHHRWEGILAKHRQEQEDLLRQIWVIREQLAVSEREIQVLRQEYRDLEESLANYGEVLEHRGHLMAQLNTCESITQQLQVLFQERLHLEHCLSEKGYAQDLQAELQQIVGQLVELAYDERDHALVRGQVDRLRWAEIRQAEIRQAERKQAQLRTQRPDLVKKIAHLETAIAALTQSETAKQIAELETQIVDLGYNLEHHQQTKIQLRVAQDWRLQYQQLEKARQEHPRIQQHLAQLTDQIQQVQQRQIILEDQAKTLAQQLEQCPDPQTEIERLQRCLRDRQQQREHALSRAGALQQQLTYLDQLQAQFTEQQQLLLQTQRCLRIYQELAQAFGRNGLQALLIEHVLPQLEAETNHLLGRLSAHQLHVQFVTQKAGRSRQGKLIDTLDIVIADAQGTRPYETYSGGEAFRVNFAIRLALARLLAQRSGTPLQTLIIDEGFGTQDREGCDRLIGAINAIASDFACILAVTHIPHFREAFQTRVDVVKTPEGSCISTSM